MFSFFKNNEILFLIENRMRFRNNNCSPYEGNKEKFHCKYLCNFDKTTHKIFMITLQNYDNLNPFVILIKIFWR